MVVVARLVGVVLLILVVAPPAVALAPPRSVSGTFDFSGIDEAANDAVASGEIPGVVVLVGRGDDILLQRAYGSRRRLPHPAPMTGDTISDIASPTTPVGPALPGLSRRARGARK